MVLCNVICPTLPAFAIGTRHTADRPLQSVRIERRTNYQGGSGRSYRTPQDFLKKFRAAANAPKRHSLPAGQHRFGAINADVHTGHEPKARSACFALRSLETPDQFLRHSFAAAPTPTGGPTLLACFPPSAAQLLRKPSLSSVRNDLFIAQRPNNRRSPLGAICGAYPKPPFCQRPFRAPPEAPR
jgi:hypothetical protein